MEAGGPTEAEHIIGDMYHRARDMGLDARLLRVAYCHLQATRRGGSGRQRLGWRLNFTPPCAPTLTTALVSAGLRAF